MDSLDEYESYEEEQRLPEDAFSEERHRYKAKLYNLEYLTKIRKSIKGNGTPVMSVAAERALLEVVEALYDPANVLAIIKDTEMPQIDARLLLFEAEQNFRFSDINSLYVKTLTHSILQDYNIFITRAVGGRERDLQAKDHVEQTTNQRVEHVMPVQKRGFLKGGGR